jgi:Type II secretion system (T2SS), protein E, N-terminal domain
METMAKMANGPLYGPIPRFDTIRRVPSRYYRIFPLALMKVYQFAVIGAAGNTLTIAIVDQQQSSLLESLKKLTGRAVFAVFVDRARMRLLIERIERCERRISNQLLGRPYYLHSIQSQSILRFLSLTNRF